MKIYLNSFRKRLIINNRRDNKKKGQSRETGNIDEEKQNKNTTQYVVFVGVSKIHMLSPIF
jgi:hypothetical protein